jgi:endonuclease/exonuclease/phosphatase family metal-dependent hydrolase
MQKHISKILWFCFLTTATILFIQSLLLFWQLWFSPLIDLSLTLFPIFFFITIIGCIYFFVFQKKRLGILLFGVLLLAGFKIKNNFPLQNYWRSTAKNDSAYAIKIMTWNVQGMGVIAPYKIDFEKRAEIIALVKKEKPDVLMLQEMSAATDSLVSNNMDSIAHLLGYKNYFYDSRKEEGLDTLHHFGRIILTNFPVTQKNVRERKNAHLFSDRICYMDVIIHNKKYRFVCTHLESMKTDFHPDLQIPDTLFERYSKVKKTDNKLDRILKAFVEHHGQADMIKQFIDTTFIPVFLGGDFNDVVNSYVYQTISNKLNDAHLEAGKGFGRSFSRYLPTLRIDFIFTPKDFRVLNCYTIQQLISDHYPVIAEVELCTSF